MRAVSAGLPDLLGRARALEAAEQLAPAELAFRRALALDPRNADLLGHLGILNLRLGRLGPARKFLEQSVAIDARPNVLVSLAGVCLSQSDPEAAEAACRRAVALAPLEAQPRFELAWVLLARNEFAQAEQLLREAIDREPELYAARRNLGTALHAQGKTDAAAAAFMDALRYRPDDAQSWINLAIVQRSQNQPGAAESSYRTALRHAPQSAEAHHGLAMVLLGQGRYAEGLPEYEYRLQARRAAAPTLPGRCWQGEMLRGTLLLHFEQGLGDTIQFVRFVAAAARRAGQVILCVQPSLERLVAGLAPNVRVVAHGARLPRYDAYAYLLSLPYLLGTEVPAPADTLRYLAGLPEPASRPPSAPQRIGIVWNGSPTHEEDRRRSIAPGLLAPLVALPGIEWISLNPGVAPPEGIGLPATRLADFRDTASVVDDLDLVISVDTASAHLAGALGRPVWLLLAKQPDWRWGVSGDTTEWYPTMRLYRQQAADGWAPVIAAVAADVPTLGSMQQSKTGALPRTS